MKLGNNLYTIRRSVGLSQEAVAEKLGVSRQTISKWETDETVPDIYQAKKLSALYKVTLDELIAFDLEQKEIADMIEKSDPEKDEKINWTNAWGKKYPILMQYQETVDINKYAKEIRYLLDDLRNQYHFNNLDALLVLKDILYHEWKHHK